MKFIYKLDFRESIQFLKSYILHGTKLLWYRLRTGKPWPLYDCYYDKMEEDLDNVPELDPFFVLYMTKMQYESLPVDMAIRDCWMPYLYTTSPFLMFFRNSYVKRGHHRDLLPLSIGRHPKILVRDYELHISQEDFDWIVKFVKDNRRNLRIFGHFNDDKAYDRIEDYIKRHPAPHNNAAHFEAFKTCRSVFIKRMDEAIKDCKLFNTLYYCHLYILSEYANDPRFPYHEYQSDYDIIVDNHENSLASRELTVDGLRVLRDMTSKFAGIDKEPAEKLLEPYGWSLDDVTGKYFDLAVKMDEFFAGVFTVEYPSPIWGNLVEIMSAKQRERDYAAFAYLWAVWIFSLNVRNFIYDTFELFWEEYEKMDKDRLLNELKRFHEILGTKTADGQHIYDRLSHTYNYGDNGYGRKICAPNIWDEGSDILTNAILYIEPFFQLKKDITKTAIQQEID